MHENGRDQATKTSAFILNSESSVVAFLSRSLG